MRVTSKAQFISLVCLLTMPAAVRAQGVLTSGVPAQFSKNGSGTICLPPGSTCYATVALYQIDVPASAPRLDIVIAPDVNSTLVEGWMSLGQQPRADSSGAFSADFYAGDASPGASSSFTLVRGDTTGRGLQTGT